MQLMHEDLERLPNAISVEVVQALEPLENLQQNVQQVLENYDRVLAIQRQTLDELAHHMSASAAQVVEQKVSILDSTIHRLTKSLDNMEPVMRQWQLSKLPSELKSAQKDLLQAADRLTDQSMELRPRQWQQALWSILAGIVGALLIAIGQSTLSKIALPSEERQMANWARAVWNKATPKEREWLQQIANRPGS